MGNQVTNPLQHWDGTDQEFWLAIHNPVACPYEDGDTLRPSANQVLGEILQLAGERAEQIHRSRALAASGYKARLTTFQLQMGVTEEELAARQAAHAERCRQEIAESRYIPRKLRGHP